MTAAVTGSPPYRTAAELGILDWEHEALVALVGPLSRSELPQFSMVASQTCIGGLMWRRSREDSPEAVFACSDALRPLLFPTSGLRSKSQPQAAAAIERFLTSGDPGWNAIAGAGVAA